MFWTDFTIRTERVALLRIANTRDHSERAEESAIAQQRRDDRDALVVAGRF
jgi:hypothetical protein